MQNGILHFSCISCFSLNDFLQRATKNNVQQGKLQCKAYPHQELEHCSLYLK